ncbi:SLAP domain-containing protein [Lysinibacillus yapensis]|uniref:SLAP domain-containing protein n=1 Tax=Ureibacillus yapensis TaxID=2304605 RepID=A0A396S7U7_9BACL|nr:SLAP domain-containing protein [Lysinibacillus yapensis]RHW33964.1 SLAP domain-containing protein [Lysinibacillus yapensis]
MQQLQFEASWDKALADQDRKIIEAIFNETVQLNSSGIICSPIREAINHKEELLVTVLVHNFTNDSWNLHHTQLQYSIKGKIVADHMFTLPKLEIPPKMSMPWTFIFPKDSYLPQTSYSNGRLNILPSEDT